MSVRNVGTSSTCATSISRQLRLESSAAQNVNGQAQLKFELLKRGTGPLNLSWG
jgi:hypothetical protein